jgi:glycine/D-amino acid oxidase-like deaminating enzyme
MTKIARRNMLRTIGGISLAGLVPLNGAASNVTNNSVKKIETDILVVGGGTAGVIAAIQAARAGCSTILVENGSQLGGTTTTGGVAFPGLFHAWGKQIVGGIGWELVKEVVRLDDGVLPDFSIPTGKQHWKHQVRLNGYLYSLLAEEKCLEAGVQIRYYETPVKAAFKQGNWHVETVGKGTHTLIKCNQLIDCTGNASVTSLAGFNVLRGQEIQPGTLMFKIGGYDPEKLDFNLLETKYNQAVDRKELARVEFRNIEALLRSQGDNNQHLLNADSTTSETHTLANINGRTSLLKMLRFLRTLPGCENTHLLSMQQETAVRETYRIDGEYRVTHEDYVTGKIFDDSVSYSFYPIDLHDENGIIPKHLSENTVATVPLRALIPKNSRNFLVAGRCISSDRLANSALRVQASCMGMGQAAGAAAALAFKLKTTPLRVPMYSLNSLIAENGGIVP